MVNTDNSKTLYPNSIKFDPRVSLGHIIQVIMIIMAILLAWQNLDKRVMVLEESRHLQSLRDQHQDALANANSRQIKETLTKIEETLLRLDNKIETLKRN